jgi:methionyl-tRNA formyltransferase
LSIPSRGFYNFHFGLFPKYKGADPIFWQLKNAEGGAGFVIHKMTEEIDGGPILLQEKAPIFPGENYGLYSQRMGLRVAEILDKVIERGSDSEIVQQSHETPVYFHKPSQAERTIDWDLQSADKIESLVNACNPRYGGAFTKLRGMEIKILEVSPADVNDAPSADTGTIIYADALYGLIVACKDLKFLRITVISMREGYLSGSKLFSIGVKAGEKFHK